MKKIILTFLFALIATFSYGQFNHHNYDYRNRPKINFNEYCVVDSFPLERISIYSPFDYESDKVISMGSGDYLIEIPHKDKIIIKKNKDNTKAIILYNSYCFGRHKEFNIKDQEVRTVLWYEDDDLFCGYIYDKKYKVCKYFETKKTFNITNE